jgi:hypothetical protein
MHGKSMQEKFGNKAISDRRQGLAGVWYGLAGHVPDGFTWQNRIKTIFRRNKPFCKLDG